MGLCTSIEQKRVLGTPHWVPRIVYAVFRSITTMTTSIPETLPLLHHCHKSITCWCAGDGERRWLALLSHSSAYGRGNQLNERQRRTRILSDKLYYAHCNRARMLLAPCQAKSVCDILSYFRSFDWNYIYQFGMRLRNIRLQQHLASMWQLIVRLIKWD